MGAARDQGEAARQPDLTDQDVAPLPARPADSGRQRLARPYHIPGEDVLGHDDQVVTLARSRSGFGSGSADWPSELINLQTSTSTHYRASSSSLTAESNS